MASTQPDFDSSLSALVKKTTDLNGGGLTSMLKMTAVNGYKACGTDLYVDSVDFMDSTKDQKFGPNKAVPPPIDLTNRFYEISANSTYRVEPFVDLSAVPLLSSVPGIGSTATLSAKIKRCAEFPQGLVRGPGAQNSSSAAMQLSVPPSFASPALAAGTTIEPWNRPKIYEEIEAAGLKVVGHTVVVVKADNSLWTDTGLTVNPAQTVWLDFRADGAWGGGGSYDGDYTADGRKIDTGAGHIEYDYNLLGSVGPRSTSITNDPYWDSGRNFNVGSALYRYNPGRTGPLMLGMNSYEDISTAEAVGPYAAELRSQYAGNRGSMTVRIIITQ